MEIHFLLLFLMLFIWSYQILFKAIWLIDGTLAHNNTRVRSRPGSNENERDPHTPYISWIGASPPDEVSCPTQETTFKGCLTLLREIQAAYSKFRNQWAKVSLRYSFLVLLLLYRPIGLGVECSPMARETEVQSLVESYQSFKKWFLIPSCLTLSIIKCVSRAKWIVCLSFMAYQPL